MQIWDVKKKDLHKLSHSLEYTPKLFDKSSLLLKEKKLVLILNCGYCDSASIQKTLALHDVGRNSHSIIFYLSPQISGVGVRAISEHIFFIAFLFETCC